MLQKREMRLNAFAKIMLMLFLISIITFTFNIQLANAELWGDIDNNGLVSLTDVAKARLIYSGFFYESWPPIYAQRADLDFNGRIDFGDPVKVELIWSGIFEEKELPMLFVDLPTSQVECNEVFSVNVSVANVTDLWALELKFWYNSTLINATDVIPGSVWRTDYCETIQNLTVPGRVWYGIAMTQEPSFNGNGTVATITFNALQTGKSLLHLNETLMDDSSTPSNPIEHSTLDGYVTVVESLPQIYVSPLASQVAVNEVFSVNVSVANVTDLGAFEFKLWYNTTVLNALNVSSTAITDACILWLPYGPNGEKTFHWDEPPTINDTIGRVWVAGLLPPWPPGQQFTGSGPLVTITFVATESGSSLLDLYDTGLFNEWGDRISHTTRDGSTTTRAPVGGISIPVDKLELLAPYIGLTILLAVAVVAVVYVKKRKRNTEIFS